MVKKTLKRKISEIGDHEDAVDSNNQSVKKKFNAESINNKRKWINKQRVLVFASRGIGHRHRHLMEDLKKLMPHHRTEPKVEKSKSLEIMNEMSETRNCNKALFFESRKSRDLYMWLSNISNGPSAKFFVENIHTMAELKFTGNCLKGSRPILSFSEDFEKKIHFKLIKELFVQIFGVPKDHPKSQPFFDHVYTFSILDNRIWFRNFQILSKEGALVEIGPRFVLNPIKIFTGSFGGDALWANNNFITPAKLRRIAREQTKRKYIKRVESKVQSNIKEKIPKSSDIFKEKSISF